MHCALLSVQEKIGIHDKIVLWHYISHTDARMNTHTHTHKMGQTNTQVQGVTKQNVHHLICSLRSIQQNKCPRKFLGLWIVIYEQQFSVHDVGFALRNGSFHSNLSQNETIASLCLCSVFTEIKMFYYIKSNVGIGRCFICSVPINIWCFSVKLQRCDIQPISKLKQLKGSFISVTDLLYTLFENPYQICIFLFFFNPQALILSVRRSYFIFKGFISYFSLRYKVSPTLGRRR